MPVSDDQTETAVEHEAPVKDAKPAKKARPPFLPWFLVILLLAAIAAKEEPELDDAWVPGLTAALQAGINAGGVEYGNNCDGSDCGHSGRRCACQWCFDMFLQE